MTTLERTRTPSPLLTRKEAAKYLGVQVKTLAVWLCVGRYNLPCIKIGRLAKYRQADLDNFIEQRSIGDGQKREAV
jgi:excisionase family DNA binding protein